MGLKTNIGANSLGANSLGANSLGANSLGANSLGARQKANNRAGPEPVLAHRLWNLFNIEDTLCLSGFVSIDLIV